MRKARYWHKGVPPLFVDGERASLMYSTKIKGRIPTIAPVTLKDDELAGKSDE